MLFKTPPSGLARTAADCSLTFYFDTYVPGMCYKLQDLSMQEQTSNGTVCLLAIAVPDDQPWSVSFHIVTAQILVRPWEW